MLGTFIEQLNKNTFVLKHADSNTLRMKVKRLIEKIDNYELEVFKPIAVLSSLNFSKGGDINHPFFGTAPLASGKMLDIQSIVQPLLKYQIGIESNNIYYDGEFTVLANSNNFLYDLHQINNVESMTLSGNSERAIAVICYKTSKPLTLEQSDKHLKEFIERVRNKISADAQAHSDTNSLDLMGSIYNPTQDIIVLKQLLNCNSTILLPVFTICQSFELHIQDEVRLFSSRDDMSLDSLSHFITNLEVKI